ncbi:precorrin-4 C(11)-methyltransferase [Rhodobacterales bacterium 56_14_T64]|nr:precorrin-4 C(11)-methyltransferase [Rhodobacterales bacterium 56_14_T64]
MTVHFIGAGPGAADLITLRGRDLIASCPVCLYAGSLVPEALLQHCPADARIINTASMSLDEIIAEIKSAHDSGHDIARLHSGDLSVWSAMGEQLRRLRALDIPYDVTPGVPAFAAAAAALGAELTLPGVAQSLILTRTSGRASSMPDGETLENFAKTGATLAIHLSVHVLEKVISELTPHYGGDCPVAIVWRATWPDQRVIKATLETLEDATGGERGRTALILVGRAIGAEEFDESCLYAGDYDRRYRPVGTDPRFPEGTE